MTDTALTGTTRPIMESILSVPGGQLTLQPGTYWLDWIAGGTLASGPWQPPVTIIGQTTTGNARQFLGSTNAWQDFIDTGSNTQQGAPFLVLGEIAGDPEVGLGVVGANFGLVIIGDTGTGATITITNTGNAAGEFGWTAVSAPFALTGGSCGSPPVILGPGESCTLQYSFSPTSAGSFSQTVTVSAGASSAQFTLSGEAAAAAAPVLPIPTLGQWGLMLLGAVLLLVAGYRLSARGR